MSQFYHSIAQYYDLIFPVKKQQIAFIQSIKNEIKDGQNWLDIGCGTGNLIIGAGSGFDHISGIDLDQEMILIAKSKNPQIDFKTLNMLDIDTYGENIFDLITCFGNTIPHLKNLDEIDLFFQKVRSILKPGGVFAIQIIYYDRILNDKIAGLSTIENDEISFKRAYHHRKDGLIDFETDLFLKTKKIKMNNCVTLFPVLKQQLEALLIKNGFHDMFFYGGFNQESLGENSVPLIIITKSSTLS